MLATILALYLGSKNQTPEKIIIIIPVYKNIFKKSIFLSEHPLLRRRLRGRLRRPHRADALRLRRGLGGEREGLVQAGDKVGPVRGGLRDRGAGGGRGAG